MEKFNGFKSVSAWKSWNFMLALRWDRIENNAKKMGTSESLIDAMVEKLNQFFDLYLYLEQKLQAGD